MSNKIKELRKNKGLTQIQVAEKLGVNQTWVSKIERGEIDINNMTVKKALELSKALGVTVEDLV